MRLAHPAVADQMIPARSRGETRRLAAQAHQIDTQRHILRSERLATAIGIDPELGRYAGLEDGYLKRQVASAQQLPAMRAVFFPVGFDLASVLFAGAGRRFATEEKGGKQAHNEISNHSITPSVRHGIAGEALEFNQAVV